MEGEETWDDKTEPQREFKGRLPTWLPLPNIEADTPTLRDLEAPEARPTPPTLPSPAGPESLGRLENRKFTTDFDEPFDEELIW